MSDDGEMYGDSSEMPTQKLNSLRITDLDDDDDEDGDVVPQAPVDILEDDDDDEDDDYEDQEPVSLGFLEKPKNSWSVRRELFPSIAGGTPAWLDPVNFPSGTSCLCDFCGQPLQFLLQVYAPLSQKESTFHRTLFVFMCTSMSCLLKDQHDQWKRRPEKASRSVKVFRCQLPRLNSFYSSEPPRNNGSDKPSTAGAVLCSWCGTWRGDKTCGDCRKVRYCSEKHQTAHWRSGHKVECRQPFLAPVTPESTSNAVSSDTQKVASKNIWPQFEIVHEDESEAENSEHEGFNKSLVSPSRVDESVKSLLETFEVGGDKKSWATFQERISRDPEQVLRYYRSVRSKPLWPLSSGQPSRMDIPRCNYCNGTRACEFQVHMKS
ncbi:OLC1v1004288C1 [Oldenlandia corymbosa var. corymbosa]|uniref:OLC1v1004288C1 n=1 Tax=Oldenlandia corymbosa var. corymbosa TaxID=529605 RepID=A0AAV1DCQ5_OLDCO|nr:OLC1v1004288C1 [Oldenlandia corymbosa var. corymbosa]